MLRRRSDLSRTIRAPTNPMALTATTRDLDPAGPVPELMAPETMAPEDMAPAAVAPGIPAPENMTAADLVAEDLAAAGAETTSPAR